MQAKDSQIRLVKGLAMLFAFVLCTGISTRSANAYTQPDVSCLTDNQGYAGKVNEEGGELGLFKGIKGNEWFDNWTGECERVSSIFAYKSSCDFIEFGWSLGYDPLGNYWKAPQLFEAWRPPLSCPTAHNPSERNLGTQALDWHTLALQDGNQDGTWSMYIDGQTPNIGWATVDFGSGSIATNSERHTTCDPKNPPPNTVCDSAWAHYDSLQQWKPSNSGYTLFFSQGMGPYNTDPWYYWNFISETETYVKHCSVINC